MHKIQFFIYEVSFRSGMYCEDVIVYTVYTKVYYTFNSCRGVIMMISQINDSNRMCKAI